MEKILKNIQTQTFEQHSSELNISDVSDSDLYKMITTDFEFDFFGDKVKVITDYEKGDKDKKLVQLVKLSEPKKSFGVHYKLDIVDYLKNHYH